MYKNITLDNLTHAKWTFRSTQNNICGCAEEA